MSLRAARAACSDKRFLRHFSFAYIAASMKKGDERKAFMKECLSK
ncbi:PsiF family protein [Cupriavidus sp. M-11]